MPIGFGVLKGDEEDYIIDIFKRTPVVIALHYVIAGLQKELSNVAPGAIYAPKKHVIDKQLEKCLKAPGEIFNHAALLIGAETDANGVNYWNVQDSRGVHNHNLGIFFIKRPSNLAIREGCAIYQTYYPRLKEERQT